MGRDQAARLSRFFTGEKIRSARSGQSGRKAPVRSWVCRGFAGNNREFCKKPWAQLDISIG
jgi:hypothetical protein